MKIVLNADDFGRSPERNRAIDDSFKQGLISSAGLIVTGKYLDEAVAYIEESGYQKHIHLHFNLSTSMRDGDSEDTPLTEAIKRDPFFCKNGRFKPYKCLPGKIVSIRKWRNVYRELEAQYSKFRDVTHDKADYSHVDFHLWYNLTWPVSVALNLFTWKYGIKSVRYIGQHQVKKMRYRRYRILSWNPFVKSIPATNIDYFLSKKDSFFKCKTIELYCHPHYKNGVLLDDSPSYLKHERLPMTSQILKLGDIQDVSFVSWAEVL